MHPSRSSTKSKLCVTLALVTAIPAHSQQLAPVPSAEKPGFDAIKESDLRANLAFVASDALAGRMSLRPGDDAVVEWIASEFGKAGLTPAAKDASGNPAFLQALFLRSNHFPLRLKDTPASVGWPGSYLEGGPPRAKSNTSKRERLLSLRVSAYSAW